ncbi:hypothetical protein CONPUDRAFT_66547, partial [Coniophora puteana RWD-64-598 SS2]
TINSAFMINPDANDGCAYAYDSVVRNREERRHMDAGDCECCRAYYENVGPMPRRLQQPLWRSPSTTPRKEQRQQEQHGLGAASSSHRKHRNSFRNPSEDDEAENKRDEIEAHKKAISKHRYHWPRAKTPPGYWDIGFPSTPEVDAINARASAMHRDKRRAVEREAS